MACPYFYPVAKSDDLPQPARAPLGALYHGRCEAGGRAGYDACNFGYPRAVCASFPNDSEADAVRFSGTLYILERDHVPVRYGPIDTLSGALARQAEVFRQWAEK